MNCPLPILKDRKTIDISVKKICRHTLKTIEDKYRCVKAEHPGDIMPVGILCVVKTWREQTITAQPADSKGTFKIASGISDHVAGQPVPCYKTAVLLLP